MAIVDAVFGLQYGDEGKGKITAAMASSGKYDLIARYNGGPNAGHTILVEDKVVKTRQLPCGVLFGIDSYIGPGTVIDLVALKKEINTAEEILDIDVKQHLIIDPRVPMILDSHLESDKQHYSLNGTASTGSGIAPSYSDYYARRAVLANQAARELGYRVKQISFARCNYQSILLEGAQGFYLDIVHGDYPNTTSSHCVPSHAATTFGFSPRAFRDIIGIAKCYETRSGVDDNFMRSTIYGAHIDYSTTTTYPEGVDSEDIDDMFMQVQHLGKEFGVNTGRRRACKPIDVTRLAYAVNSSGVNKLVIQKMDILRKLDYWFYYQDGLVCKADNEQDFIDAIENYLENNTPLFPARDINWLSSPKATYSNKAFHND